MREELKIKKAEFKKKIARIKEIKAYYKKQADKQIEKEFGKRTFTPPRYTKEYFEAMEIMNNDNDY